MISIDRIKRMDSTDIQLDSEITPPGTAIECWCRAGFCDASGYLAFTPTSLAPSFSPEAHEKLKALLQKMVYVGPALCSIKTYLDQVLSHFQSWVPKLYLRGSYATYILNPKENLRVLIEDFLTQFPKERALMKQGWDLLKFPPLNEPNDSDWALLMEGIPTREILEEFRGFLITAHSELAQVSAPEALQTTFKTLLIPHQTKWSLLQDPIVISSVAGDDIKLDLVSGHLLEAPYLFTYDNRYLLCGDHPEATVIAGDFWQSTLDYALQTIRFEERHLKDFYALMKAVQHLAQGKNWDESVVEATHIEQSFITIPLEEIASFLIKRFDGAKERERCLFIFHCLIKNGKIRDKLWSLTHSDQTPFNEEAQQVAEQIKAFPEAHGPLPPIPLNPFLELPRKSLVFMKKALFFPLQTFNQEPQGIYAAWRRGCERLQQGLELPQEFIDQIVVMFLERNFTPNEQTLLASMLHSPTLLDGLVIRSDDPQLRAEWLASGWERSLDTPFVHNLQNTFLKIIREHPPAEAVQLLNALGPKVPRTQKGFVIKLWIALFQEKRLPIQQLNDKVEGWLESNIPVETKKALSLKVMRTFGTDPFSKEMIMAFAEHLGQVTVEEQRRWFMECVRASPERAETYFRCHYDRLHPLEPLYSLAVMEGRALPFLEKFSHEVSEETFREQFPQLDPRDRLPALLKRPSQEWKSYTESELLTNDDKQGLWNALIVEDPSTRPIRAFFDLLQSDRLAAFEQLKLSTAELKEVKERVKKELHPTSAQITAWLKRPSIASWIDFDLQMLTEEELLAFILMPVEPSSLLIKLCLKYVELNPDPSPVFCNRLLNVKPFPLPAKLANLLVDATTAQTALYAERLAGSARWIADHVQLSGKQWMEWTQALYPLNISLPAGPLADHLKKMAPQQTAAYIESLMKHRFPDIHLLRPLLAVEQHFLELFPLLLRICKDNPEQPSAWASLFTDALKRCMEFHRTDLYRHELQLIQSAVTDKKLLGRLADDLINAFKGKIERDWYPFVKDFKIALASFNHLAMNAPSINSEPPFKKVYDHLFRQISKGLPQTITSEIHEALFYALAHYFDKNLESAYQDSSPEFLSILRSITQYPKIHPDLLFVRIQLLICLAKHNYHNKANDYLDCIRRVLTYIKVPMDIENAEVLVPLWLIHPKAVMTDPPVKLDMENPRRVHLAFMFKLGELLRQPEVDHNLFIDVATKVLDIAADKGYLEKDRPLYALIVAQAYRLAETKKIVQQNMFLLLQFWLQCSPPSTGMRPHMKLLIDALFANLPKEQKNRLVTSFYAWLKRRKDISKECLEAENKYLFKVSGYEKAN